MLLVIGKENCGQCKITQEILKNKNIKYEYRMIEDVMVNSVDDYQKYIDMAANAGQRSFPLIIREDKIIKLQEV